MKKRNWLDLSRKLVDRFDMDYSVGAIQEALGEASLNFFGDGVLPTSLYPNPFPLTLSNLAFQGTVGNGIAFDVNGQITRIDPASTTSKIFTPTAAHASLDRWDLLVIRYKMKGQTSIPKPSDPMLTVFLNLIDDFELAVLPGTPSVTPAYPTKGSLDIILAGLRIAPGDTVGTDITVDLSVREIAAAYNPIRPVFKAEVPTGTVDGVNQDFTISETPQSTDSIIVYLDGLVVPKTDWSLSGQVITLGDAPVIGQSVFIYYVVASPQSQNPLAGQQETPSGAVNGVNDTFTLVGKPADNESTLVFVDGVMAESDEWSLLQGAVDQIVFQAGSIPAPGQSVYVFYFVNASSVGIGLPPVSGSGYTTFGTYGAPATIAAASGVPSSTDQRQARFVKSAGGSVVITANPQVAPGSVLGQEMLLQGTSDTDYIELNDGTGLALNGPVQLTNRQIISLFWDGVVWVETSRS